MVILENWLMQLLPSIGYKWIIKMLKFAGLLVILMALGSECNC